MDITKMTSKGQVVIPQDMRLEKGIKEGERFLVYDTEDSIVLKRIKNLEKAKDMLDFEKTFAKTWRIAKKRRLTRKDVNEEIKSYRIGKDAKNNS
ncbi:MAG: AbrB/MazE/SpoVT family DNA-binding domain-containing protein [Nanoarchaeota archaeon]|nr:AbrB/MazE/SpoVT family DNA-binding domain-containing protein [Nanoarchaeota archaeon]